jgi:hypothetical protein
VSERRACAATFETVWVIATCLEESGHGGPHWDYGNCIRWTTTTSTPAPVPPDAGGKA